MESVFYMYSEAFKNNLKYFKMPLDKCFGICYNAFEMKIGMDFAPRRGDDPRRLFRVPF